MKTLLLIAMAFWSSLAIARDYDYYYSPNMLFSVRIPSRFTFCREDPAAPNVDVRILLDSKDCRHPDLHSEIVVGGMWNVFDEPEIRSESEYAQSECGRNPVSLSNLKFDGLPLYTCEIQKDNDYFETDYYTIRSAPKTHLGMLLFIRAHCKINIRDQCLDDIKTIVQMITLNTD